MKYKKEYSIEWIEECEADTFKEAEEILDNQADEKDNGESVLKHAEVEMIEDGEE